jgi:FkbM family methyltransferase
MYLRSGGTAGAHRRGRPQERLNQIAIRVGQRLPGRAIRWLGRAQFSGQLASRLITMASQPLISTDLTITHGLGQGLRFNAAGTNPGYALGTTEPSIQQAVCEHLHAGDVFYDVGANVGFFTVIAARRVGPFGRVAAFEPVPATVEALLRNLQLNGFDNVTVVPKAAAASSALAQFEVGETSTQSRLRTDGRGDLSQRVIEVETIPIDELVERGDLEPPSLVKIDVEGAELEAVRGMRRTIQRYRPVILCEMHGTNAEFAALMRELGYDVAVVEDFESLETAPWWVHALAEPVVLSEANPAFRARDFCNVDREHVQRSSPSGEPLA